MAFTSRFRSGAAFGNAVFNGLANFKGGIARNVKTITASYTVAVTDDTIIVGASTLTVTLPAASAVPGQRFTVKNGNFITTTVATAGGNIDAAATDTTPSTAYAKNTYVSNGTQYFIV